MPDPEIVEDPKPVEQASALPTREELLAEIDARLQTRDQALLGAINQQMTTFAEQMQRSANPQQNKQAEEVQQSLNISPEDFWRDPGSALNKFHEVKVKPILDKMEQNNQNRSQPDPTGIMSLVEVQKMQLAQRVGTEEFTKYQPFLQKVLAKTDPRVIADAVGMDAVWRLTKSYADDYMSKNEQERLRRNAAGSLSSSGAAPNTQQKKVDLNEDQAYVAKGMGISPEHFEEYSKVEEIEIGSNRKAKK